MQKIYAQVERTAVDAPFESSDFVAFNILITPCPDKNKYSDKFMIKNRDDCTKHSAQYA
jgi:hypothetical protein